MIFTQKQIICPTYPREGLIRAILENDLNFPPDENKYTVNFISDISNIVH